MLSVDLAQRDRSRSSTGCGALEVPPAGAAWPEAGTALCGRRSVSGEGRGVGRTGCLRSCTPSADPVRASTRRDAGQADRRGAGPAGPDGGYGNQRVDPAAGPVHGTGLGDEDRPRGAFVVPRKQGVYRQTAGSGGRDLDELRLHEEGEAWPEGWLCAEKEDGCAAGILWDRAERVGPGPWGSMRLRAGHVKPGESKTLDLIYAFVGDGNWQTIRGWWQTLFGSVPEVEASPAPTHRPIEFGIEPGPLLIAGGKAEATLRLSHVGEYKLNGELILEESASLRSDVASIKVRGFASPIRSCGRWGFAPRSEPGRKRRISVCVLRPRRRSIGLPKGR